MSEEGRVDTISNRAKVVRSVKKNDNSLSFFSEANRGFNLAKGGDEK